VLWIGYLQWHFRTRANAKPAEPVLRNFRNIEHRDALLTWQREELVRGPDRQPLTRWDAGTRKPHPVTGKMVPDEEARVEVTRVIGARSQRSGRRRISSSAIRHSLAARILGAVRGEGYAEALWDSYRQLPQSADYVMYWWNRAAQEVSSAGPGVLA